MGRGAGVPSIERVVLDTNGLISAAAAPKDRTIAGILTAFRAGDFTPVTSRRLLDELAGALNYPRVRQLLNWTDTRRAQFVEDIAGGSLVVEPAVVTGVAIRDEADLAVIEAAVAGGADCIVTGDKDLLALGAHAGIEIVPPARFLAMLSEPA